MNDIDRLLTGSRTTMTLPASTHEFVIREAKMLGVSAAAICRRMLDFYRENADEVRPMLFPPAPRYRLGGPGQEQGVVRIRQLVAEIVSQELVKPRSAAHVRVPEPRGGLHDVARGRRRSSAGKEAASAA